MEILFAQLIVSPAVTEQRQMLYPLLLNAKQGSSNSHLFNVFWYDAAWVRTHDLLVVRRMLY